MAQQKIFTAAILAKLAANGKATRDAQAANKAEPDHVPVVKVFNPYGGATWLLTESEPGEPDTLFGLCDLGQGFPELGNVLRSEIENLRISRGGCQLPLERDAHFTATRPLSVYVAASRVKQAITESKADLDYAAISSRDKTNEAIAAVEKLKHGGR